MCNCPPHNSSHLQVLSPVTWVHLTYISYKRGAQSRQNNGAHTAQDYLIHGFLTPHGRWELQNGSGTVWSRYLDPGRSGEETKSAHHWTHSEVHTAVVLYNLRYCSPCSCTWCQSSLLHYHLWWEINREVQPAERKWIEFHQNTKLVVTLTLQVR